MKQDGFHWYAHTHLEKRHAANEPPYEVIEKEGNVALQAGIGYLFAAAMGATANHFDNANAKLFVGNGTQATNATQTALQGASFFGIGMTTNYPSNNGTITSLYFKGVAATDQANFAWTEWGVGRGNATTQEVLLNRKTEALGTKSGGEWSLEVYLSLS